MRIHSSVKPGVGVLRQSRVSSLLTKVGMRDLKSFERKITGEVPFLSTTRSTSVGR